MTAICLSLRTAVATAAVLAALGLLAGTASADRYVSKGGGDLANSCASETLPCYTIQNAVTHAAPGETIHIGPGTYQESLYVPKPLVLDGNRAGTLQGVQFPGRTIVVSPDAGTPAIQLTNGGEVRDLRAEGNDGGNASLPPSAIELSAGAPGVVTEVTIDGVIAIGGVDDDGGSGPAIRQSAPNADDLEVTVTDSGLAHGADSAALPLLDVFTARATVTNATVDPSPAGLIVRAIGLGARVGVTALRQLPGTAAGGGFLADSGGRISVDHSHVTTRGPAIRVFSQGVYTPSSVTATDSAFASLGNGSDLAGAVVESNTNALSELTLRRSTLLAYGPDVASGVSLNGSGGAQASVVAEDSVIRATDPSLPDDVDVRAIGEAGGSATFSATRAAFTDVNLAGAATATQASAAGNVPGNPLLVDEAAGDLALRSDSPAVDRGSAAGLAAGAVDAAGAPRSTDGNGDCAAAPDLGAFERSAVTPCTPPATDGGTTDGGTTDGGAADTRAPVITDVRLSTARLRRATMLRWTLDEAAAVRVAVQRRLRGRWVTRKVISAPAEAGRNKLRIARRLGARRLTIGRYRLRLVARDAAGNRSAPGLKRFRVVRLRR